MDDDQKAALKVALVALAIALPVLFLVLTCAVSANNGKGMDYYSRSVKPGPHEAFRAVMRD